MQDFPFLVMVIVLLQMLTGWASTDSYHECKTKWHVIVAHQISSNIDGLTVTFFECHDKIIFPPNIIHLRFIFNTMIVKSVYLFIILV